MPLTNMDLDSRRRRYFALSSRLVLIDAAELRSLLGEAGPARGWGATHTMTVDGVDVFVKRVPVTDRELENPFTTANVYDMPTFYNYGVGSAGFGAFREIVAHIRTTNWVLAGEEAGFPLLYHHRIVPLSTPRPPLDEERHRGYVAYWNDDANIGRYLRERADARHEVILFLEHFPHVLDRWLLDNLHRSDVLVREMRRTLAFLREHGVLHFDAHFANILVDDGGIPYLTDYGLVLDRSYGLTDTEQEFFRRHLDYDDAEFLMCLGGYLGAVHGGMSADAKEILKKRYGFTEETSYPEFVSVLLLDIETIHAQDLIPLPEEYVSEVRKHRGVMLAMGRFFAGLRRTPKKDTPYPEAEIRRALASADAGG
jgi:hypothetical protein